MKGVRLTSENANLYRLAFELKPTPKQYLEAVHRVGDASAIVFDCPVPETELHERHRIVIFFAAHPGGAPVAGPDKKPAHRWRVGGNTLADVSVPELIDLSGMQEGCAECASLEKPCPVHPHAGRTMWASSCPWRGRIHDGVLVTEVQ